MKTELVASLIIILLIVPQALYAFQNEPDGFRGIKWGTEIKTLNDMKLKEDDADTKYYVREKDKLQIGDADIQNVYYGFYKGQFYFVSIHYNSFANFKKLQDTLLQLYGQGERPNQFMEKYIWLGATVSIIFKFNEIARNGAITYMFEPIGEQRRIDDKNKAKKGAGDL